MIKLPRILPWHMFILDANLLITSPFTTGDINDTKSILFAETTIPGLSYAPVSAGGFGNRKISFSLQIIQRNGIDGNRNILKLFEILRHPASSLADIFKNNTQFVQNPKVVYNYGIGSAPLVWYVTKCDITHTGQYVNAAGNPRFSKVDLELTLDEKDFTNEMEKVFRQFAALNGAAETTIQTTLDVAGLKGF
jgi:hypothetical protein